MELLRVVDTKGNNTNEILEREELHNQNKLHNEVTIYVINSKKEVLLQRRGKNRRFSPNKLGVIAGHVSYEEVGVKVKKEDIHKLSDRYLVKEEYNNHFMYPYYIVLDKDEKDFKIQKEELSSVKWYKIEEVIKMINDNSKELVFKKEEIPLFNKLKNINSNIFVQKIKNIFKSI